jgi:hypothetical protein
MAAGDYVVKGGIFNFGIGGFTYANVKVRKATYGDCSEVKEVTGEQAETLAEIYTNPGRTLKIEGGVLAASAYTTCLGLIKGSVITVNSKKYTVRDVSIDHAPAEATVISLDLMARDSMQASL